jgi:ElaB/YqjD/DUF883 family membrane-anchored ribosome-binding protein
MKRGLYDSEYDRIRHAAGYMRPRFEFPDDTEEKLSADRVEQMRRDFRERMNEVERAERDRAAAVQQRHKEHRETVDRLIMENEYKRIGLTPPNPLCSLGFLLSVGWRIEQIGDRNVLTRPGSETQRKTREQWEDERNNNAEGS